MNMWEWDTSEKSTSTKESLFPSYIPSFSDFQVGLSSKQETIRSKSNLSEEMVATFNYSITSPQFEGGNVSDYTNGLFSSTNKPVLVLDSGSGSFDDDGGSSSDDDDETLSLPLPFTQISQLNKNCIVAYTILFVFAAVGNLLVLSSVTRHDRLGKSRTPLLIMNLCIADLIVTFFLMPTEIFWRLTIAWKGGDLLCKLSQFIRAFGLYLSSNVVICISVDRYFAIVYPLKLAGAVKRVKCTLVAAWTLSAIFAGPQMLVYHVASHPKYPEFRQCVTQAFLKTEPYNELIYNVSSVSALYFIPLVVIIYTYTMILWKIHRKSREHRVANEQEIHGNDNSRAATQTNSHQHKPIELHGSDSNRLSRSASRRARLMLRSSANQTATLTRARARTLRLTLLILLTFIFCWTPYVVMTLWYMVDRGGASQVDERLQETLFIMAITNSGINPLIYGTVGRKQNCEKHLTSLLRSSWANRFIRLFCCCCLREICYEAGDSRTSTMIMTNMGNGTSRMRNNEIPHTSRDLSPVGHVVTVRTLRSNSGVVSRIVRSFRIRSRQSRNHKELGGEDECLECGVTSQYIVPEGGSLSSPNLSSTRV